MLKMGFILLPPVPAVEQWKSGKLKMTTDDLIRSLGGPGNVISEQKMKKYSICYLLQKVYEVLTKSPAPSRV